MSNRCGRSASSGSTGDQRKDPNCPNVLLINTDDMAWADLSINNPSKLIPTPNLDRLVSKGINFRDGHSCTSRCAPSRYCLMTGRYHFRRGDYHYKERWKIFDIFYKQIYFYLTLNSSYQMSRIHVIMFSVSFSYHILMTVSCYFNHLLS